MEDSWLPPVQWAPQAGYTLADDSSRTSFNVGRTVRKKRHAKHKQVSELAESTITFQDVDLHVEAPAKKKAKTNVHNKPAKDEANAATVRTGTSSDQDQTLVKTKKKKDKKTKKDCSNAVTPNAGSVPTVAQPQESVAATSASPTDPPRRRRNKNKFKSSSGASEPVTESSALPTTATTGQDAAQAYDALPKQPSSKLKRQSELPPRHVASEAHPAEQAGEQGKAAVHADEQAEHDSKTPANRTGAAKLGKQRRNTANRAAEAASNEQADRSTPTAPAQSVQQGSGGSLQQAQGGSSKGGLLSRMRSKLQGAHFRMLNEELYTMQGAKAFEMMQAEPSLFDAYHEGFRAQTKGWNSNPVDIASVWLKGKPAGWTVADFGCGDAQLARELSARHTVLSFDLVARNALVTACNMASVPCDAEAQRVLRQKGLLWIAEVRSRFVPDGAEKEDFKPFISCLRKMGFGLLKEDTRNRMFVVWVLTKTQDVELDWSSLHWPALKACIYKRR